MEQEKFRILSQFLEDHSTQVGGRVALRLSADEEQTLRKLAAGEVPKKSIEDLLPLLRDNSKAVTFLADQIKSRRKERSPAGDPNPSGIS